MTILQILEFPDPRLRTIAKTVDTVDESIRTLLDDMLVTMYDASGIGLAATQINIHQRIVVIDVSETGDQPQVFINPEIIILDGPDHEYEEGCLSVPGFHETVSRPEKIIVKALDRDGNPFELQPEGLLAVCIQHEVDHLNGKLFVDHISQLKRKRIRAKLEKQHKQLV
ncbi:peptide deformylase [marine gamma proteobacterium HTCC2143]|jgi:peptide deformylase|uniref:Peptide deformylase n=1 Tax=marine gamma proteobacterium HTCC2143 TaxID=247633 RepID=A0Y9A0_9GAMM|nr:peptide deformylase [marine gamma proteobacterium HTCC2143]